MVLAMNLLLNLVHNDYTDITDLLLGQQGVAYQFSVSQVVETGSVSMWVSNVLQ